MIEGENVIVYAGGDDGGALTAFDAATGKVQGPNTTGSGPTCDQSIRRYRLLGNIQHAVYIPP